MATKILNDVTIQSRVDTLANWVSKNPVLANGELALVRDGNTIEIRVGDGVTNFSGLTKLGGVGIVDDLTSNSSTSALSANQGRLLNENKVDKVTGKGLSTNNYDDDSKAKVDAIPLNPKYTDTIVDLTSVNQSISSLNINMNNKVDKVEGKGLSTNDYDNVSKDKVDNIDVNLSNLMPISDGVLENYTEKLTTLASGAIDLNTGNVFTHTLSGDTTYSITNAVNGVAHSFTLIITQTSTVRTLTFPSSVKWQGGVIPDLSTASKTYVLTFMTIDGGTNWLGMFGGEF